MLLSFKKTTVHINLLEYFCFHEIIPPFVDFVRYPECSLSDILARHDSNTVCRGSCKKSVDYFMCSICRCGIDQALFHQLMVFGYPANAIAFNIAHLLCYCEKDNLCSLLDSGRKIFYWSKLTMLSPRI